MRRLNDGVGPLFSFDPDPDRLTERPHPGGMAQDGFVEVLQPPDGRSVSDHPFTQHADKGELTVLGLRERLDERADVR